MHKESEWDAYKGEMRGRRQQGRLLDIITTIIALRFG